MRSHREMVRIGQVNLRLWRDYSQKLSLEELDLAAQIFIGSVCGEISREKMENHITFVKAILGERRSCHGR